jgi:hypothetical protein
MPYQLVLDESPVNGKNLANRGKDFGDNVFLNNIPSDYKVYAFYYPGSMPNEAVKARLQALGEASGKNLYVSTGSLKDPAYQKIVRLFNLKKHPVIVVTAVGDLAAQDSVSAYAKLDNEQLLSSPERTVECVQEVFNLFIQGRVAEALKRAKGQQRSAIVSSLMTWVAGALKSLRDFVAERDISVSLLEGKFELKRSGG